MVMRSSWVLLFILLFRTAAFAVDLKIKVVDPQSAVVPGAQVSLQEKDRTVPLAVNTTSAEGVVVFTGLAEGQYAIHVLAPGFAPQNADVSLPRTSFLSVSLSVASPTEMVVVSATRSPVPEEETGASVSTLESGQLETMQPVAANDALRFLPGAVVDTAGQRGGLGSLFVRGGDSRYNKVIVDDVPINEPGGTFDFGVVPLAGVDRLEFVRGAQSTLYGSDAMTSVVQVFTRTGTTQVPELFLGADGGNLYTAHGYLSLAGARGPLDYNLFGDQFNTNGQGPNDDYSNALLGANIGVRLTDRVLFRARTRHSNSRTGVQGEWNFNGQPLIPPDMEQRARQNNLLASAQLTITGPSRWQHRLTGFEYNHRRLNEDDVSEAGRVSPLFGNIDFQFRNRADINRAGVEYQGDYVERTWAHTTVGYQFEDENGFVGDLNNPPLTHGLRLNHALYGQQALLLGRFSVVAGARFVHNQTFGNKGVPRVAVTLQAVKGGEIFSGTRFRFSYATGIKEPRFEESFASPPFVLANPNLKAEENRAFESGVEQSFLGGKYALSALYFNNQFRNQIDFETIDPINFVGRYVNINKSMAHGAELELKGRLTKRVLLDAAYNYTSTQILQAPFASDTFHSAGQPLLRRPKHSGSMLLDYLGSRWGGELGGTFVGRRPDSDFEGFGFDHAAGYARVDLGGWYAIHSRVTAYLNVENALNKHYEEVVGYPALHVNFRAGIRFRIGCE
jgi:vitamin B12 transporter